ncbi:VOC family protein [Nisaea sp.]|uniref:VOC family protein n=1 Tax=Nisaea sp. TaxID=2024842 RepID=UPI0032646213
MPKIDLIKLRCLDPARQRTFYTDILGMNDRGDGAVTYGAAEAGITFENSVHSYQPSSRDTYWKVALAVPNIELAYEQLTARGVEVGVPRQFQDVGYLTHFQDPEGFTIELIEHWFKGNRPATQHDTSRLGGGACLNLLTLRTGDIAPIREECLAWGMAPLSVQDVKGYGFTLHFFAFTDDTPPNPNLTAVENREWLYQRPYTVLEIQEVHEAGEMVLPDMAAAGYAGTEITSMPQPVRNAQLLISGKTL